MPPTTFKQLEQAAWLAKAAIYDEVLAALTAQAIAPILDAFGTLRGKHVLDVACGTGHLTAAAARRGADVEGLDFAATMVAKAVENYPNLRFVEGDAEALPYADESFDAVTCAFGLLHMEHPDKAIKEIHRVLREGGTLAFTVWCGPDQGGEFFALIADAIQAHGTMDVPLPPAPPAFHFADPGVCERVLHAAGFRHLKRAALPLVWRGAKPEDVLDLADKGTVRTSMQLRAQTDTARAQIHRELLKAAKRHRSVDGIALAWPAILVTAVKS